MNSFNTKNFTKTCLFIKELISFVNFFFFSLYIYIYIYIYIYKRKKMTKKKEKITSILKRPFIPEDVGND